MVSVPAGFATGLPAASEPPELRKRPWSAYANGMIRAKHVTINVLFIKMGSFDSYKSERPREKIYFGLSFLALPGSGMILDLTYQNW
jgi:hypothetical protein